MASKTDMERVGLFKELSYHTVGDPYHSQNVVAFNTAATKGKQLLSGGIKMKSSTTDGYFESFKRVFEGEAYSNPILIKRKQRIKAAENKLGKDWVPTSYPKDYSGIGSYYGTFSGSYDHFSGLSMQRKSHSSPGKNIITSTPKKGTGYGYIDVTIGKYPEYKSQRYDTASAGMKQEEEAHKSKLRGRSSFKLNMHPQAFFDTNPFKMDGLKAGYRQVKSADKDLKPFKPSSPSKKDGGMKAGTLSPFPTYASNPYKSKASKSLERPVRVVNSSGKTFLAIPGPKSAPVNSVLSQNVLRTVNTQNYKSVQSVMSY